MTEIERDYDPALLGFVVDVPQNMLAAVKEQLVSVVSRIESDEKAYIYHINNNSIPRWTGEAVAAVANFKICRVRPTEAVKKILDLWSLEDPDAERYIFYVANSLEESQRRRIERLLRKNADAAWERKPIWFFFVGLGDEEIKIDSEQFTYIDVSSTDWIASQINQHYHRELVPFLVKNYQPLDVDALKAEYKEKYGGTKNKNGSSY